jgi:ATP-dependent DNA helicase DinG
LGKSVDLDFDNVIAKFATIKPREYQKACLKEIITGLHEQKEVALLLPTGMGKSVVYLPLAISALERGYRVCILTATNLLLDQVKNRYLPDFKTLTPLVSIVGLTHYDCRLAGKSADYDYCASKPIGETCTCDINRELFENHGFVITNFAKFLSTPFTKKFDLVVIDDSHGFENSIEDRFQTQIGYARVEDLFERHDKIQDTMADVCGNFLDISDSLLESMPPDELAKRIPDDEVKKMSEIDNDMELPSFLKGLDDADKSVARELYYFIRNCKNLTQNQFYIQRDYYNPKEPKDSWIISRRAERSVDLIMRAILGDSRVILVSAYVGKVPEHATYCTRRTYGEGDLMVTPSIKPKEVRTWFDKLHIYNVQGDHENPDLTFDECADLTGQFLSRSHGKCLLLFKNYRDQRRAEIAIKPAVKNRDITFVDDSYETEELQKLVEKADVIMASASSRLWEGINISNLKLEVIFSLPFIRPPVYMDITKSFPYVRRRMLIRLQQGIGRLIRNEGDSGVCVVLNYAAKPSAQTKLASHMTSRDFSPEIRDRISTVGKAAVVEKVLTHLNGT